MEPRPSPPGFEGRHDTTAQLRRDIESGQTGDKVAVIDPAAASLGTDDEAAGHPPDGATIAATRARERTPHLGTHPANTNARQRAREARRVIIGGILIVLVIAVAAFFMGSSG
ncbi:hypothetical protein IAI18_01800 [Acetobacteraceae bacterium H6797]|nr:hypothetical protein [Acetobacteraceae bacterium H6797]